MDQVGRYDGGLLRLDVVLAEILVEYALLCLQRKALVYEWINCRLELALSVTNHRASKLFRLDLVLFFSFGVTKDVLGRVRIASDVLPCDEDWS